MKRNKCLLAALVLATLFPLASQSEDINVDFTATVLATTCSMSITALDGSSISGDATNGYKLTVGDVGLDKIVKKSADSQKNFKIVASDCSAGTSKITTSLASSTSTSGNFIKNESTDSSAAKNIGMGIKRKATTGETYLTPGSGSFDWAQDELTVNAVEMTVALRELTDGAGTIGAFSAKATFNFTYQ
ncbi:fimbrial protein [Salmonella enterica]|uniref:Fimbrial protein n=1 Tax=Salmonella oranienberg TaxID=28147 RepID=A0A5I1PMG2_SALON|nr:fimbrial protein [Salmonella enterica]EAA5693649.1 fimbrial protein [Salmonella enterica subsp. enterica serovar Oranienburg]EBG6783980.1 fimbrial protein [Salmonella enterica subsp. enterica]HCM6992429.1 fimbrial protein [Salmonella enterica subsp. enterica serovar Typhimurium str. D23580]EAB1742969.1 fimbrial protein [Salmonella enterica]EAM5099671.1 fimbrial protein [Salmonella enterica]